MSPQSLYVLGVGSRSKHFPPEEDWKDEGLYRKRVFVKKALLDTDDPYTFNNWKETPHLLMGHICLIGSKILSAQIQVCIRFLSIIALWRAFQIHWAAGVVLLHRHASRVATNQGYFGKDDTFIGSAAFGRTSNLFGMCYCSLGVLDPH